MISQVSATIKDKDLLAFLKMVNGELTTLINKHDIIIASEIANETPIIELNGYSIEAVSFIDDEKPYHEDLVVK